ncbi:glycosyltransferase family 4 protein [Enorma massiliensis]|uniref:glycosyltransferase family 4 protein n=1 Tax=Enorma massiliensis TaxID=1472761 RepID=UPI003A9272B1
MRILYLADTYRPARTACANRTAVLVGALRDAGHDVSVLASTDSLIGAPEGYELPAGVTYFETFPLVEKTLVNRFRNNFGGAREAVKAADGLGDFDVVVCTTPPLLLTSSAVKIARRKRAKLVVDVRDVWPDVAYEMGSFEPGSLYGRFFEHIARKAYAASDLVVSVSPGKVEKLKGRVPDGRVVLVPNGIDETFLESDEDPILFERLRLDDGLICAYVGNIGLAQGLGTLLDIAKVRPGVRFLLFGDGADRASLEARAEAEGIGNVEFCGKVNASGVRTALKRADVSYVPLVSSRLRDSIPTKMYEALACGCPVLLAAEGDAADLLDACGLGAHAAPEDPAALQSAFDRLLERPFSDEKRSAASKWVVENHSRQKFANVFVKEIEEMAGKNV